MSRFDHDPEEVAREARELHERTTKDRASFDGGAPPFKDGKATAKTPPAEITPENESMAFPFRMSCTFSEDDPVGRVLAERLRALPEASRKHYSVSKAIREAILDNLDEIAKRL